MQGSVQVQGSELVALGLAWVLVLVQVLVLMPHRLTSLAKLSISG